MGLQLKLPRLMLFALETEVSIASDNRADCYVTHLAVFFFFLIALSLITSVNNFRRLYINSGEAGISNPVRLAAGAVSNHSYKLSNIFRGSRLISR